MWLNLASDANFCCGSGANYAPSGPVFWDCNQQRFYTIDQNGIRNSLELNASVFTSPGLNLDEIKKMFQVLQNDPELRDSFNALVTMARLKS